MMKSLRIFLLGVLWSMAAWSGQVELPFSQNQQIITAAFDQPTSVASADDGRFFVLDGMKGRVVVFSLAGQQILEIGTAQQLPDFSKAVGLSWSEGKLYIADTANHRILVLSDQGGLEQIINLPVTAPEKHYPEPVAVQKVSNRLFYTDRYHHRLCFIRLGADTYETVEQTCVGERGEQSGNFQFPYQIAVDKDNYLHVVDVVNGRVQVFNSRGKYFSQEGAFAVDILYRPNGIAIDEKGYQYVSDAYLGTIAVFAKGHYVGTLKDTTGQNVKFKTPVGLWADAKYLYVTDAAMHQVHKLQLGYQAHDEKVLDIPRQSPEISRKNCVACHFSWGFSEDRPLKDKEGVDPVAALEMCYSCHHGVVFESRQAIQAIYDHGQHPTAYDSADEKQARQNGLPRDNEIPEGHPILADGEMLCTTCHTPHNTSQDQPTLYVDNTNSWMRIINKKSDLCENCHESNKELAKERDVEKRGKNHPIAFKLSKPPRGDKSGHYSKDKHLQKGLPKSFIDAGAVLGNEGELICQSCHQVHGGQGDGLVAVTDEEGQMCGECHQRQYPKGSADGTTEDNRKLARKAGVHPINTKLEKAVDVRGEKVEKVICQSCHSVHAGTIGTPLYPDDIIKPETLCADCHERQSPQGKNPSSDSNKKAARKAGVHPVNIELEEEVKFRGVKTKVVNCQSCHSLHDGTKNTPLYPDKIRKAEKLCVACHERHHSKDLKDARKKGIHVFNEELENKVKIGKGDNEVEVKTMGCLSCHSIHRGEPNTPALIVDHKNGALCENCHEQKQRVVGTDHDFRVTAKKSQNRHEEKPHQSGACGTCHTMHKGKKGDLYLNAAITVKKKDRDDNAPKLALDELCLNCHQETEQAVGKEKPIKYYGHPYKDMILRSDPEVMPLFNEKTGEAEELGVMACITCHEPHSWKPAGKNQQKKYKILNYKKQENEEGMVLNSFLRRKGVEKTFCVDCHNIEALLKYKYFHNEKKARGVVDYLK